MILSLIISSILSLMKCSTCLQQEEDLYDSLDLSLCSNNTIGYLGYAHLHEDAEKSHPSLLSPYSDNMVNPTLCLCYEL